MPNKASNDRPEANNGAPSNKKRNILIAFGIIIILVLIGVIFYLLNRPEPKDKRDTRATFVTPENVDEINNPEPIEAGYYVCTMNTDWNFKDSSTPSDNAYVENVESNTHTVYFDLTLKDTGKLVYSSPYIPLGEKMNDIKLDADLKAGDYPAIITYNLVDDDKNILSNVAFALTLHIEN